MEEKVFIIAELSGNHNGDIERAKKIIDGAVWAGADAIKLQTYTADTITLNCNTPDFKTGADTIWAGKTLYELYQEAYTPWEWHKELMEYAKRKGILAFSSPFDLTAVDFLEELDVPMYKVASFEINDIRLLRYIAKTQKPIIISTGVATEEEIEEALATCKEVGNDKITLLKCTSSYPTPITEVNLNTIPYLKNKYDVTVGLSDHTLGTEVAIAAVALGARVVEKHLTLRRADGGVDSAFSMEPNEFKDMVDAIRNVEQALGSQEYILTQKQLNSRRGMRSLYISEDVKRGDIISEDNIKSVRPSNGLNTRHWEEVIGKRFNNDFKKGTPMSMEIVE